MRHLDLGVLDGPILLFGGPYSNLQATQAVLEQGRARDIAADHMICSGDVVAYCGAPAQTVAAVRAAGCAVVAGNCELQLAANAEDCGCGFEDGSACDLLSVAWYAFARTQMSQDDRDWMGGLPDVISFVHHGARYGVLHGGVRDVARFIWPVSARDVFNQEWDSLVQQIGPVDHVIAGHCGVPFVRQTPRGQWINAGVIGMPPHDGAAQTRFALLSEGKITIEHLTYDAAQAAKDMDRAGLPKGYRDGLLSGLWPSEDILPDEMKSQP